MFQVDAAALLPDRLPRVIENKIDVMEIAVEAEGVVPKAGDDLPEHQGPQDQEGKLEIREPHCLQGTEWSLTYSSARSAR